MSRLNLFNQTCSTLGMTLFIKITEDKEQLFQLKQQEICYLWKENTVNAAKSA